MTTHDSGYPLRSAHPARRRGRGIPGTRAAPAGPGVPAGQRHRTVRRPAAVAAALPAAADAAVRQPAAAVSPPPTARCRPAARPSRPPPTRPSRPGWTPPAGPRPTTSRCSPPRRRWPRPRTQPRAAAAAVTAAADRTAAEQLKVTAADAVVAEYQRKVDAFANASFRGARLSDAVRAADRRRPRGLPGPGRVRWTGSRSDQQETLSGALAARQVAADARASAQAGREPGQGGQAGGGPGDRGGPGRP